MKILCRVSQNVAVMARRIVQGVIELPVTSTTPPLPTTPDEDVLTKTAAWTVQRATFKSADWVRTFCHLTCLACSSCQHLHASIAYILSIFPLVHDRLTSNNDSDCDLVSASDLWVGANQVACQRQHPRAHVYHQQPMFNLTAIVK